VVRTSTGTVMDGDHMLNEYFSADFCLNTVLNLEPTSTGTDVDGGYMQNEYF